MTAKDAINNPIICNIDGREYKIREIGFLKLWSIVEKWIIEQKIKKIKDVSSIFDNSADKIAFVGAEMEKLPDGKALEDAATELMKSGTIPLNVTIQILYEGLKKDQSEITFEDVCNLAQKQNADLLMALTTILGTKKEYAPTEDQ